VENLVTIPRGVSFPRMREIAHQNVYSASFFQVLPTGPQPMSLNRFSRIIRQTSRSAQGCAFSGLEKKHLDPVILNKPPFSAPLLTGLRIFSA